jgi:hypothetical protein
MWPIKVKVCNFLNLGEGKTTPFGVYDISYNEERIGQYWDKL